jgi:ribulose-phosphate 3-epimerase
MIDASGYDIRLEIDGGVKAENIREVAQAGCDTFVSGSGIFGKANAADPNRYNTIIKQMREELAKA